MNKENIKPANMKPARLFTQLTKGSVLRKYKESTPILVRVAHLKTMQMCLTKPVAQPSQRDNT